MNWLGPIEFTLVLFAALFLSWIKAIFCVAAAVLIRHRWASMAVAAVIGAAESAVGIGLDIFFVQFLDIFNDVYLAMSALAGVVWWGIGRALYAMVSYGTRSSF